MPIACKRNIIETKDSDGNVYNIPSYYVFVFRKEIPIILFYLAHGIHYTLSFLQVNNIIDFLDEMPENPNTDEYIYFPLSSKCYLRVLRDFFQKYTYVQGIVGMFCDVCTNRITVEQLDDRESWIKRIANPNNYEKGLGILQYFGRLLDK